MTQILSPCKKTYSLAAKYIKNGDVVAFPTETVYGLGADATNEKAVAKIFEAKGRPQDNPLIVHLANPRHIKKYVQGISQGQRALIKAFMPGPISIIFDRNDKICSNVCAGNTTVAIRVPQNKVARKFIKHCHRPICAPSANSSKRPSPTLAKHVYEDLDEKISAIIDGGQTDIGIESTVVKISNGVVYILRPGKITKQMIEQKTGLVVGTKINVENLDKVESPGIKYGHYMPKCNMAIIKTDMYATINKLYDDQTKQGKKVVILCKEHNQEQYPNKNTVSLGSNSLEASKNLFKVLREVEDNNDIILAEYIDGGEMAEALFNRMLKSANGNII